MSKRLTRIAAILFCAATAGSAGATELSKQLTAADVRRAGAILGFSSMHRPWTAHALPSSSLGVDAGLEAGFAFRRDLLAQGDGSAVIPRIIPVPRFWLSWDMPFDLTLSASFAPGFLFDGITAAGGGLQWFAMELPELKSSVSLVAHVTYVNAFADLRNVVFAFAGQVSRDLGAWQPYAGVGLATGNTRAEAALMAPGEKNGPYTQLRSHFYVGTRLDFATKLSVQADLIGSQFAFGILFADTF